MGAKVYWNLVGFMAIAGLALGCATPPAASAKKSAAGESCVKSDDCDGDLHCLGNVCQMVGSGQPDAGTLRADVPPVGENDSWELDAATGNDGAEIEAAGPADASADTDSSGAADAACTPLCDGKTCDNGCGGTCDGEPCSDGSLCTHDDLCDSGSCKGKSSECDDGNSCTEDGCNPSSGCSSFPKTASCDDGNLCTGGDVCSQGLCGGTLVDCDDKNVCTTDSCNAQTGCTHAAQPGICDDGSVCTAGDACAAETCSGVSISCDDGNACTVDTCDPSAGCVHQDSVGPCDDGNACSLLDICGSGACLSGKLKDCGPQGPCLESSCDIADGDCKTTDLAAGSSCDDSDACTAKDTCTAGTCVGESISCDDGNLCTTDTCKSSAGCQHANNTLACDDALPCTESDQCANGTCGGKTKLWTANVADGYWTRQVVAVKDGFVLAQNQVELNKSPNDVWLEKRSLTGEVLWTKSYPNGLHVAAMRESGGTFWLGGSALPGSIGTDFWLLHADAAGTSLWQKTYLGLGEDSVEAMVTLPDGLLLAGTSDDAAAVLRVSSTGALLWKTYLYSALGSASAFAASTVGDGVVVAGQATGTNSFHFWMAKLTLDGKEVWNVLLPEAKANENSQATRIVTFSDGFVLAGVVYTQGGGGMHIRLVRTNADGKILWDRQFGGNMMTSLDDLQIQSSGLLLAGTTAIAGKPGGAWLVRVNDSGNIVWDRTFPANSKLLGVSVLPDGIVAGGTMVVRMDAWGNGTCAASGSCLAKGANECGSEAGPCTGPACTATTGCASVLASGQCNADDNACTEGDTCVAGVCVAGKLTDCDDQNSCTKDSCDAKTGDCVYAELPNGTACDDSNACTLQDGCSSGACVGVAKTCPPGQICSTGSCQLPEGMAFVPAGAFKMGCVGAPGDGLCVLADGENPQHQVALDAFFIDITEVTVSAYAGCVDAGKCTVPKTNNGWATWAAAGKEEYPVNLVTWGQADMFCKWKGKQLPTEAQWEKAARGGLDGKKFPWGDAIDCNHAVYDDGAASTGQGCDGGGPLPVASKPAGKNGYGLFDMAGNVREWVADFYSWKYYSISPAMNPNGPGNDYCCDRVRRGGGFGYPGSDALRVSSRWYLDQGNWDADLGFRCAMVAK